MNISEWNQQQTTIGHLKLRCTGSQEDINRIVLRLRVERLLSNADLHPPGLGTGAILIVRKLDSPAPVELSMPLQSVQADWHELLRSQVAALYAAAARPALDAVPLDASSVLFADPGEMLTCLTRDLLNGQEGEHWYWQRDWGWQWGSDYLALDDRPVRAAARPFFVLLGIVVSHTSQHFIGAEFPHGVPQPLPLDRREAGAAGLALQAALPIDDPQLAV